MLRMPTMAAASEQQDHQAKARDQDAEDALMRDLLRRHRDFSIARVSHGLTLR